MLASLQLQNFRGFSDHHLWLSPLSVLVGRNNAGKSTLIEALRLLAEVLPLLPRGRWMEPPSKFSRLGQLEPGVELTLPVAVRPATVFHRYTPPPALIDARFSSGGRLQLVLADAATVFAVVTDPAGRTIRTRNDLPKAALGSIIVLPQLGPLEETETTLKQSYVRQCLDTHRTSRQFRNQLRFLPQQYPGFVQLFHDTWPGVRIAGFDSESSGHGDPLSLLLSEDGFVAEAADFGHGMQVWLQLVWFLSRVPQDATVVLDEPDVYVHPEQQACLTEFLRRRPGQTLVATHSPTIMSQCTPEELVRIHRATPESRPGTSENQHQQQIAVTLEVARTRAIHNAVAKLQLANCPTSDQTNLTDLDVAKPGGICQTVCIEVRVYENAAFTATDSAGNVVLHISADGSVTGKKLKEIVDAEPLTLEIQEPENVEVWIDGKPLETKHKENSTPTFSYFQTDVHGEI
ncbi:MAG: AAA family ATPase [Planctomyces sp.]|jgi:hypothetical protein